MFDRKHPAASPTIERALSRNYNDYEMSVIDELSTTVDLKAGQTFIREGMAGREALVLLTGSAAVSRGDEIIATVGPGDIVGEASLLTGERRNATLIATTDTKVAVFNPREFSSLLDRCPRLKAEIKTVTAQRG